jgi:hypothetical protein
MNVPFHAARIGSNRRNHANDLLAAFTAEHLAWLQFTAASVAEHEASG